MEAIVMWFRLLRARLRCLFAGHWWFYHKDYTKLYRSVNQYVRKRSCGKCGKTEVGVPVIIDEITFDWDSELSWPDRYRWISKRRAERIMRGQREN
jgi:uncharacterized protein YraI